MVLRPKKFRLPQAHDQLAASRFKSVLHASAEAAQGCSQVVVEA